MRPQNYLTLDAATWLGHVDDAGVLINAPAFVEDAVHLDIVRWFVVV